MFETPSFLVLTPSSFLSSCFSNFNLFVDGIPTLEEISKLNNLPVGQPGLHPSEYTKKYASYRKSWYYESVSNTVQELASDRVTKLLKAATTKSNLKDSNSSSNNNDWYDKQDSVDILFEEIQEEVFHHKSMDILSKHPDFQNWVGRSLEEYLTKSMKKQKQQKVKIEATTSTQEGEKDAEDVVAAASAKEGEDDSTDEAEETLAVAMVEKIEDKDDDAVAVHVPVFMDCFDPIVDGGGDSTTGDDTTSIAIVPKILHPLKVHKHGGVGKMVEEWELSAHNTTKRIMIRDTTKQIAHTLNSDEEGEGSSKRIYVHGKKGVGKSATLASIVASSRKSGYIVMYLPDGDRLSKNGFFVTPNTHRVGMYDLQDLSQEAIQQLLDSHEDDIEKLNITIPSSTLHKYLKDTQLKRLNEFCGNEDATNDENISLMDVMKYSKERKVHSPMCYSIMVDVLMKQKSSDTKFFIVMDEFNCLYDHQGHYFHMSYDDSVQKSIPCNQISLFEPIMNFMNLSATTNDDDEDEEGNNVDDSITASVIVGSTESHAIRREITDSLTSSATTIATTTTCIEIPRFTSLEVDHILANYEATGVGKLRSDRGDTIMNKQEVEYLKMCSGSIGQKLLDVSIM
jgi:hypothetical protein